MLAGLDYNGVFSLLDKVKTHNPLLKNNMETVVSHSLNEMARKFVQCSDGSIYICGLRGSVVKMTLTEEDLSSL